MQIHVGGNQAWQPALPRTPNIGAPPVRLPFNSMASALFLTIPLLSWNQSSAADLYVSTTGQDANPGTRELPLRTLAAARDVARQGAGRQAVTVHVADGIYYLPDTLVFKADDSGTAEHPIRYQAEHEGQAILSGGVRLELNWEPYRDEIFRASTPPGLNCDQIFVNGQRLRMARYPNFDASRTTAAYQGFAADAFSKERAARWSHPAGGYIHAMHVHGWGGYHYRILGTDPQGEVTYEGGWQNNRQLGMHPEFRMVENIVEELDALGEWFHDAETNTLYVMPEPGIDLRTAVIEAVRLRHLVEFQGTAADPVRYVTLQGFVFRHAARTFMDTKEPLLRSDWTIYRGGAVLLSGTEEVQIADCEFDQPGGNAIFVNKYNRRARIQGCHIHDAGASGVCLVGDPAAVREPLFEYGQTHDLAHIDRTPGPQTPDYPADCVVEDCLIHGIGRVERQTAGVQISMSSRVTLRNTSIYDCSRAGINIGDGCWGGHLIEGCDVFDTVLETSDHGSFNSWGRDRYWNSRHREVSEPAVKQDPALPFLDAVEPVTIRNSRWRCDHGWDIDLDDGSSNYQIYNNLLLQGGLKFREGYGRKAWNNVLVNCGFHPHVWFDDSASEFRQNIVMASHAPIGMPEGWGIHVDGNLFSSAAFLRQTDSDVHSLSGDPLFIDPAQGDFRVREDSPALKIGFQNFPMDRFGVQKLSLKSQARTPVIPSIQSPPESDKNVVVENREYWFGARLHSLAGGEFSAFGVSRQDLGVQLAEVPLDSPAAQAGLRTNDVVQRINGTRVRDTHELYAAWIAAGRGAMRVGLVRNQQTRDVTLTNVPYVRTEAAGTADAFRLLVPAQATAHVITSRPEPRNNPLGVLIDGKLTADYGPVFANGERNGIYKLDLGSVRAISSITSWSYNQNGNRVRQRFTLYGSSAATDPGWNTQDAGLFVPLGTIDTASIPAAEYLASSLRAVDGDQLGHFRWILWETTPVTDLNENTAWQEFQVLTE